MTWWWWPSLGWAYETDQLTDRGQALRDAREAANLRMDELLDTALAKLNQRRGCGLDPEHDQREVAKAIFEATAPVTVLRDRPLGRMLGYGTYQAWLETGPIDRRTFGVHDGIYGDVRVGDNLILGIAGTCSTIRLGDELVGTDKLDHFLSEGYTYFERSRRGDHPERAVSWGVRSERTMFGLMTSGAFSFADLRANYDGYRFYSTLLEPGSVVGLDDEGCAEQTRGWDWLEWVDWEYDEVLNPPVFTKVVQADLEGRLERMGEDVCEGFQTWGPVVALRVSEALRGVPPYAAGQVPTRSDPFQVAERCAGGASAEASP